MDEQRENLQPEQNESAAQDAKKTERGWESLAFLHDMVYLLAIVTILFTFFFRLVAVDGSSMYPTLVDKDYLVLESNFLYRNVKQSDIVVLKVDGAALDEDYVNEPTYKSYLEYGMGLDYPVEVPEGSVFVMGDNRNESADSRFAPVGCVPESQISGRVLLIVVPGSQTDKQGNITGGRVWRRIGAVDGRKEHEHPVVSRPHDEDAADHGGRPQIGRRCM